MNEEISENNIIRALKRIYTADKDDVACDEATVLMARAADAARQSVELKDFSPALKRHFAVCSECASEYQMILSLAQLAEEQIETLHIPARPAKQGFLQKVEAIVDKLFDFPGFSQLASGPVRGSGLDVAPVEIELGGGLLLEIDLALHPNDSSLRDIFVSVQSNEPKADTDIDLEGVSVFLARAGEDQNVASGMLDRYGEAVLSAVEPDVLYFLKVEIASQVSRIQQIKLP